MTFRNTGSCRRCDSREPHPPHAVAGADYHTVRYGQLSTFCPGLGGDGLEVVVTKEVRGSAESPASLAGYTVISLPDPRPYAAVWGNGNLMTETAILGTYATEAEAETRVQEFLRAHSDNPAAGAWVRGPGDAR
jgi:hypothetical protein